VFHRETATLPGWVQAPGALVRPEETIPSIDLAQDPGPTASVLAGQDIDGAVDPESLAKAEWRASMRQNPPRYEGCFHASYPNMFWESVECKTARPHFHPVQAKPTDPEPALVGNERATFAFATAVETDWSESGLSSRTEVNPEARLGCCERLTTSTPSELDRRLDVRVKALFHWTGVRCVFEPLLILRARCPGHSNRDSQAIDLSRGRAAHLLFNCRRGSGEVNIQTSGNDAHSRQHARSE
jgi:hypothetical protein